MSNIADKIWLTGRIRMVSEARLRRRAMLWNILIIWYSVGLTCLSVYQLISASTPDRNLASAILSILVLSLSIYIPTLGFERQADQFRSCYLRLQHVSDTAADEKDLAARYHEVLHQFPNHPNRDWFSLLVMSWLDGTSISSGGKPVPVPWPMIAKHYFRVGFEGAIWIVAFSVPFLLYILLLK